MRPALLLLFILLSACASQTRTVNPETQKSAQRLYQKAIKAYRQGQAMPALQAATQSVKADPNNAHAHELLGIINQRLDRAEQADKNFQQAMALAPADAGILTNYASLQCQQKNYSSAEQNFIRATELVSNPAPEIAWTNAALCAQRMGDSSKARKFYTQALQLNPGQPIPLYQLARLKLEIRQPQAANEYLQQYLGHAPHTAKTLLLGAQIEYALKNPLGLNDYINKLRSAFPDSTERTQAEALLGQKFASTKGSNTLLGSDWVSSRAPTHFTIQVTTNLEQQPVSDLAATIHQTDKAIFRTQQGSDIWHTLIVGDYPSFSAAQSALSHLPDSTAPLNPWIRDFKTIQNTLTTISITPEKKWTLPPI